MILIFDTTLTNLEIAISKNNKIIAQKSIFLQRDFSKKMINEINQFLKENKISFSNIEIIYFTNGPGSFTSVRLGVVFAKTLAIIKNIKIYTIDSLSAYTNAENGLFSIRANGHQFFTGEFKNYLLNDKIYLTEENKSQNNKVKNVLKNMLKKINLATKWKSWKDVSIFYVKKI